MDEETLDNPWFRISLERELESKIPTSHLFDIHILNNAGIQFSYNAIFRTTRLVVRDETLRVEYETRILLTWYDMEPTWEMFYKAQSEALSR